MMRKSWSQIWLIGMFVFVGVVIAFRGYGELPRDTVPADGEIVLEDYGYRQWGPELVNYRLPSETFGDEVVVAGPDGKLIASQTNGRILSFVAEVPRGERVVYQVRPREEDDKTVQTSLKVERVKDGLMVATHQFALRLPGEADQRFQEPVPAAEVPTPLKEWRPADGPWMGECRFAENRRVKRYRVRIVRNGPVCFAFQARYTFANGAEYLCRIRVSPRTPFAEITEEVDASELERHNKNFLIVNVNKGWNPERVTWVVKAGETDLGTRSKDYETFLQKKRENKRDGKMANVGLRTSPPPPRKPDASFYHLGKLYPGGKWGQLKGGVTISSQSQKNAEDTEEKNGFEVGVIPFHVGGWRRAMALHVWGNKENGVNVSLPLDARWMWWQYDTTDERSPFSTHEHDPGLKETYARRVWALYFGDTPGEAQGKHGYIGLDRYKDWQLDWQGRTQPSEQDAENYPRAWYTSSMTEEHRKHLENHPDRDILSRYYVISGDSEDAVRHGKKFLNWIQKQNTQFNVEGLSHYRQAQTLYRAHYAGDALACPQLPDNLRSRIKRYLALWAYLMSSPDFNPRGSGVHLGNNNMTINRTMALAYFASLLPDHPQYGYWMDRVKAFTRFKLATQTAVDGTWVACPNYQLYGPTRFLDAGINILNNTGVADLRGGYQAKTLRYLANLTMQDPRFNNFRIIPGMGNSADRVTSIFGLTMRSAGPKMTGYLKRMHQLCVGDNGVGNLKYNSPWNAFSYKSWAEPADIKLDTSVFPTYGVMFRHKFGKPEETGMLFRAGLNWSHWDTDVFNVILYGEGAPLSPGTGYGYYHGAAKHDNAIYHNQVKLVQHDKKEIFGRVDAPVRDYGFTKQADYAMGERYYPPGLYEDEKPRRWRRHILFLKDHGNDEDDSYFVMRDTFPGNPESDKTWWTWLNLGEPDRIRVEGTPLPTEETPHGEPPKLAELPVFKGNSVEMKSGSGAGTRFWFAGDPLRCRARVTFTVDILPTQNTSTPGMAFYKNLNKETKTVFEAMAAPGEDYFYVVYPHENDESVPAFEKIAPGCLRIENDTFTDYAFIGDKPLDVDTAQVRFSARSGSIRVFDDRVVFSLTSGKGRIGYKGYTVEGRAPFQRVVKISELENATREINGGNAREWKTVSVGDGIQIRGEGDFEAELQDQTLLIQTRGRKRVLLVDRPAFIRRPQYWIDGKEWMACWTDWPASGAGSWKRTHMMALPVPAGEHELVVQDMEFPPGWKRRFSPILENVKRKQ